MRWALVPALLLVAAAPARADFFDDARKTFQTDIPRTFEKDIPHFFQKDVPRAFGADGDKKSSRPAEDAKQPGRPPPANR